MLYTVSVRAGIRGFDTVAVSVGKRTFKKLQKRIFLQVDFLLKPLFISHSLTLLITMRSCYFYVNVV